MAFEFVDLRRGDADRYLWIPPFDWSQHYEHDRWWDELRELDDDPWFVQVLENRTEVARIGLDDAFEIDHYAGVPDIGPEGLEIQIFEVASAARGRGIGTQINPAVRATSSRPTAPGLQCAGGCVLGLTRMGPLHALKL